MAARYTGADTRVFWDMEDFPVPKGRDLHNFLENVVKAIEVEGYLGEVDILAYIGANKPPEYINPLVRTRILIAQEADEKRVRLNSMLLHMLEWAHKKGKYLPERNLLVVSKDIPGEDTEMVSVLEALTERGYNVFLAVPDTYTKQDLPPLTTAAIVWSWTRLFDGEFPFESDDSEEESEGGMDCEEGNSPSQGAGKRLKTTN